MMTSFTWLPDAAWRGALLLTFTLVMARLLRSQPAAVRHVLWTGALAGVMAMPLLPVIAPLRVPVSVPERINALTTIGDLRGDPSPVGQTETDRATRQETSTSVQTVTSTRSAPDDAGAPSWFSRLTLADLVAMAWLAGAGVLFIRLLVGFLALRRMARSGADPDDAVATLADACAARLGLHTPPTVIVSERVAMPCTAGWMRPVVLLPLEAATWSPERLEVVLLHELSHVRRMDIVPHLLSEVARVVYWFNPLVWVAAARLRAEAELATDDRVMQAGARPSDYAGHLLDIVRQARPSWHPAPLMPLARRSEFEGRMLAILESGGRALPSARWAMGTVLLVGGLSLGVASMQGATTAPKDEAVVPDEMRAQDRPEVMAPPSARPRGQGSTTETTSGVLAEALNDPVASVRKAAAEALGNMKDSVAVRALMDVLRTDESAVVRRAAAWSLGQISDEMAIPALSEALLRDRDKEVRKNAAAALGSIDSPRATGALSSALERDAEAAVRIEAAEALSNIEDPSTADVLIRVLDKDDEPGVRRAVIEALDNMEGSRAVPAISRALRDSDVEVRRAAADALGSMDDREAVPPLLAVARDADAEVRRAVIQSLASLGDRRAVPALTVALGDADVEVRRAAAEGFGNFDNVRTAPPELVKAMDDRDAEVRHSVAHALGHIKDPDGLRVLIAHVSDPSVEVRQAVVESLDEFDDPSVLPALRTALKDSDPDVRKQAAEALGNRNRSK